MAGAPAAPAPATPSHSVGAGSPPAERPQAADVGICAGEVYFPSAFVSRGRGPVGPVFGASQTLPDLSQPAAHRPTNVGHRARPPAARPATRRRRRLRQVARRLRACCCRSLPFPFATCYPHTGAARGPGEARRRAQRQVHGGAGPARARLLRRPRGPGLHGAHRHQAPAGAPRREPAGGGPPGGGHRVQRGRLQVHQDLPHAAV